MCSVFVGCDARGTVPFNTVTICSDRLTGARLIGALAARGVARLSLCPQKRQYLPRGPGSRLHGPAHRDVDALVSRFAAERQGHATAHTASAARCCKQSPWLLQVHRQWRRVRVPAADVWHLLPVDDSYRLALCLQIGFIVVVVKYLGKLTDYTLADLVQ